MFSPGRPAARPVAALDRLRPRHVFIQQAARPHGREVVSLSILARPLHATREPGRFPRVRSAGEPGFEPGFTTVLETVRIAVNSLPLACRGAKP